MTKIETVAARNKTLLEMKIDTDNNNCRREFNGNAMKLAERTSALEKSVTE